MLQRLGAGLKTTFTIQDLERRDITMRSTLAGFSAAYAPMP